MKNMNNDALQTLIHKKQHVENCRRIEMKKKYTKISILLRYSTIRISILVSCYSCQYQIRK